MKIGVKIRDGQILLDFETQAGQTAIVELPPEDAQQVGLALIARSGPAVSGRSLLEESPLLVTWNPKIEITRSETGQIILAYQSNNWRPFLIQLEEASARELRGAIDQLLD